jgi:hypothetical protein
MMASVLLFEIPGKQNERKGEKEGNQCITELIPSGSQMSLLTAHGRLYSERLLDKAASHNTWLLESKDKVYLQTPGVISFPSLWSCAWRRISQGSCSMAYRGINGKTHVGEEGAGAHRIVHELVLLWSTALQINWSNLN